MHVYIEVSEVPQLQGHILQIYLFVLGGTLPFGFELQEHHSLRILQTSELVVYERQGLDGRNTQGVHIAAASRISVACINGGQKLLFGRNAVLIVEPAAAGQIVSQRRDLGQIGIWTRCRGGDATLDLLELVVEETAVSLLLVVFHGIGNLRALPCETTKPQKPIFGRLLRLTLTVYGDYQLRIFLKS